MNDSAHTTLKTVANHAVTAVFALALAASGSLHAKGEVEQIETEATPASPMTAKVGETVYQWGVGMDVRLRSFVFKNQTLRYNPVRPDRVQFVRIDNPNASGKPCAIYAEMAGALHSYQPTLSSDECPMAAAISGDVINIGTLDVFSNTTISNYSVKNIERVDLIFSRGITAPDDRLDLSGHPVLEKSGNNPIQLAAILSLDTLGQPASYGPLVTVHAADHPDASAIRYGYTGFFSINDFLWNGEKAPNGPLVRRSTLGEPLGFAFVTLEDLGIHPGQVYYGVSAFATDVDPKIHDLTNPASFPLDTGRDGSGDDADLHIGTAGKLTLAPGNQPPIAMPDTATTTVNVPVTIDVLANDADPDGDPLTLRLSSPPSNGTVAIENGRIVYTPTVDFSGDDFLSYRIEDGQGGAATTDVTITVVPKPGTRVAGDQQTSRRIIETGLQGHGAGSLAGWLIPLAATALWRRRSRRGL